MTVRDQYDAMIRVDLAPWFRAHGYRKTRNAFTRSDGEAWQRIDFQASAWGTRDDVRFTINVAVGLTSVAGKEFITGTRIGNLLPSGEDHWWPVNADTDMPTLAAELRAVLETLAEPWVRERSGLAALLKAAEADPIRFPHWCLGRFAVQLRAAGFTELAQTINEILATLRPPTAE